MGQKLSHCLNELLEELNKYEGVCETASWAFQVNRTSDDQATAFGNSTFYYKN